ncbi:hypothetical protein KEM55_007743, partial [Ascosphaera atra]
AGVSWQIYQDKDNFGDNPLAWFEQFQNAPNGSALAQKGMSYVGLNKFYDDAAKGTLPEVSFIVGPMELSEHPPYAPKDGGWLQQQVVNALVNGKAYNSSALFISYDETGGWGDHVSPYHSPPGTPGEWLEDPYGYFGQTFAGPGLRVPFYIVSPWTRGGRVFTEHADHTSQILFVEEWLSARGYKNIKTPELNSWRREHMSNLVNAFDFDNPNTSVPDMPKARVPHINQYGEYDGAPYCQSLYPTQRPPVPYGNQPEKIPDYTVEEGYKQVIGNLTEGRYLVFAGQKSKAFMVHSDTDGQKQSELKAAKSRDYSYKPARFVVHYYNGGEDVKLIDDIEDAAPINIDYHSGGGGKSRGYTLTYNNGNNSGKAIGLDSKGTISVV